MKKRTASAVWQGDLKSGKGTVSTGSGTLKETAYSLGTRFQDSSGGTNPEELIAAAHAGCFAMAFSAFLGRAGFTPQRVDTKADLTFEQVNNNWTITTIDLNLDATVPGIDQAKFNEIANDAKTNCPVSRALNAKINLNAKLQS